jgi:hypothetical protein
MALGVVRTVDLVAVTAGFLAGAMAAVYVGVMRDQGDQPLLWVLLILVVSAVAVLFGARLGAPRRRAVLSTAGAALLLLGLVSILTIGLPILAAGALALLAGLRHVPGSAIVDRR